MWLVNAMQDNLGSYYNYSDSGKNSRLYHLASKLDGLHQGNNTVTNYFNSLQSIWRDIDHFNDLDWKCAEDGRRHWRIVEANRVFKFLMGLNMEFDEVRRAIIERSHLPSIGEVFAEVLSEESRRLAEKHRGPCGYCGQPQRTINTPNRVLTYTTELDTAEDDWQC